MKAYSTELFKEFPPDISKIVTTSSSDKITVLKAKNVFSEPKGFGCYKFVIPGYNMPTAVVEKKKYHLEQKKIFPINPDQIHSFAEERIVNPFMAIFIHKTYMRDFSHILSGKSEIFYNNGTFELNSHITRLLFQFIEETKYKQPGYEFILQSLNTQITVNLLRSMSTKLSSNSNPREYTDLTLIKKTDEFLRNHLCSDFSLDDLASFLNYSPYHFIRIYKKRTGKTPFEYLTELKIQKAKDLLPLRKYSISEVSFLCGFANRTHFSTVFKRIVGLTPSEYKSII